MAKSMKMEIALIVGIVFFCCWCAYIIIKMIMSQESVVSPGLQHQQILFPYHSPSLQNHHELQQLQRQYANQLANQPQNSNQITNARNYQFPTTLMNPTNNLLKVNQQQQHDGLRSASLQFSPHFPTTNNQEQQHNPAMRLREDLHRQRQADATSTHWQATLPNQQAKIQLNSQTLQTSSIGGHAIPIVQHQKHSYNGNRVVPNWLPRSSVVQSQQPDGGWRAQHNLNAANLGEAEENGEQDNDSHIVAASSPEKQSDNNDKLHAENDAPDPDPDKESSDNGNQSDQQTTEDPQQQQDQQQDEQDEHRAARRSFSESEEEANERDAKGRPIVSHHTHLINGKPAQSEAQIKAARDVGMQRFDSIVSEIEQNEPTTPDYDENEAQDAKNAQRGDESRLVNRRLSAPTETSNKDGHQGSLELSNVYTTASDGGHDDVTSSDSEPKRKKEKHNHKLKESLTAKQWDDSQGSADENANDESDNKSSNESEQDENPEVAREKMEQESRDEHVDFADLDLLSDPNDFPFMTSPPSTTTTSLSRRRRRADPVDVSDPNEESDAAGVGLRGALIDVINRIDQKNATTTNGTSYELQGSPIETELRPPPSEESVDSLSDEDDNNRATDEELGAEKRQDNAQQSAQANGHFYAPEMYSNNNSVSNFYNSTSTSQDQLQRANNLTRFPVDATIGVSALSQPTNYTFLQPQSSLQDPLPMQMPTPLPMTNYNLNNNNNLHHDQYQIVPEYHSLPQSTPAGSLQGGADGIVQNFYPNYEMRPGAMPLGSKVYSQTKEKKKKKKKKSLLEEDKKSVKKKKKKAKKKVVKKASKGNSYKKKMAAHRGAMKKRKQKAGKKMAKGYKEFKGATKGHKGKKGLGERGAKKGTLLYKDKGYKKRGFKKAYQKLESGDHKTYFDEFRDKDHKKNWKDFKDKHQFSQNKKWAAKDKKRFDHHKLDEMKDKKSKYGAWNKKSMSKHKKDYKFKGQHLGKSKVKKKKKKKKMSQKKKESLLKGG